MGALFPDAKIVPLSKAEKQQWTDAIVKMDDTFLPALAWQSVNPPSNKHVFVASFDGTWNDREHLRDGEAKTNPALLEETLSKLYDDNLAGKYYHGVGTRENSVSRVINGMTGGGSEERAEAAFDDFQKQALAWLKEDPNAQIHVFAMGFSRGAASARHFLNLVDERGVPTDAGYKQFIENPYSPSSLDGETIRVFTNFERAPGSVSSSALLYDTVATGQENILKLGIPSSTHHVVHLVSQDEARKTFPLTSITGKAPTAADADRFLTIQLPGVHSDIGGGYETGVAKLGHYLGEQVLYRYGFDIEPGRVPTEALEEGRHRHFLNRGYDDEASDLSIGDETGSRRTKYVPNEMLTDVERADLAAGNKAAEVDAAKRYLEALRAGTAPADPMGFENVGLMLSRNADGSIGTLLSNPDVIKFDSSTNSISVYGHVVRTLSAEEVSQITPGSPLIDLFSVMPERSATGVFKDAQVLEDLPKAGQAAPESAKSAPEPAREPVPSM